MKSNNIKYKVVTSKKCRQQLKKCIKQGKDLNKIAFVIKKLELRETLDEKYRDHTLFNNNVFYNCRECHIEPDWLLVYRYYEDTLILYLVSTGTHGELFI